MTMILDGSLGVTFNDASLQPAAASPYGLKNKIINGAMVFAQRATTANNIGSSAYATLDRFLLDTRINASPTGSYTQAQSTDAPTGFNYSFSVTVSTAGNSLNSAYGINLAHFIEGYNIADLGWGTANAKTITLSFWVKSSVTGSYGFGLISGSYDASYVGQYTVSSANTWEYKTVTIPGPTIGTWDATTGRGIQLKFSLGTGSGAVTATPNTWLAGEFLDATSSTASPTFWSTAGAVWKITGVQLEQNTSATPFERRLYNQELANCQRYYAKSYAQGTVPGATTDLGIAAQSSGGGGTYTDLLTVTLPVIMRTSVSVSFWDTVGNSSKITRIIANSRTTNSTGSSAFESDRAFSLYGSSGVANANGLYAHWVASAEL